MDAKTISPRVASGDRIRLAPGTYSTSTLSPYYIAPQYSSGDATTSASLGFLPRTINPQTARVINIDSSLRQSINTRELPPPRFASSKVLSLSDPPATANTQGPSGEAISQTHILAIPLVRMRESQRGTNMTTVNTDRLAPELVANMDARATPFQLFAGEHTRGK